MSQDVALISDDLENIQHDLASLLAQVRQIDDLADLTEARARIEAVKAWAKIHGEAKALRLTLLTLEAEALVRVIDLGGSDQLATRDRKAAEYLAAMTATERAKFVREGGRQYTTIVGLCASVWREDEDRRWRYDRYRDGRRLAAHPDEMTDAEGIESARSQVQAVSAVLAELVDEHTRSGQSFTIAELAAEVIEAASLHEYDDDQELLRGVRSVCREAVARAPIVTLEGTALPRFVTARTSEGTYIRIPVENALLSHLADMVALRREQLRQDQTAFDGLVSLHERLTEIAEGDERIGAIVARSIGSQMKQLGLTWHP
jgi:hypothetical protein